MTAFPVWLQVVWLLIVVGWVIVIGLWIRFGFIRWRTGRWP